MSLPPLTPDARVGRVDDTTFSHYAGATRFKELPISKKTKDALRQAKFTDMTDIQRACLPHALAGRDILGAAKTGSGKTLAFVIPFYSREELPRPENLRTPLTPFLCATRGAVGYRSSVSYLDLLRTLKRVLQALSLDFSSSLTIRS